MRRSLVICTFIFLSAGMHAQHFIGLHKDDIIKKMREAYREFYNDDSFTNKHFNYLKFVDNSGSQTWLFFLTDDDLCKYHKRMVDYANMKEIENELNSRGLKTGVDQWEYMHNGKSYTVTLTRDEWFFTVVTRVKE